MSNVDWCSAFSNCTTIGEHAVIFCDILNECIDRFVLMSCSRGEDYLHGIQYPFQTNSKLSSKTNVGPLRQANGSSTVLLMVTLKLNCFLITSVQQLLLIMAYALFFRHACMVLTRQKSAVYRVLRKLSHLIGRS